MKRKITGLLLLFSIWVAAQGPNLEKDYAAIESKVIEWRHDIHQNPELSNREFKTGEKI
ncbi:MAG: amidohydrolase, partial [Bacteroidota bacterium]